MANLRRIVTVLAFALCVPALAIAQALPLHRPTNDLGDVIYWKGAPQIIADAKTHAKKVADAGYVWSDGRDTYKTTLGGQSAYITFNNYLVLTSKELQNVTDTSRKLYPGNCAAYIYNAEQKFESSYIFKVGDGRAETNCNAILGVSGVSYHGKPALLAIVQYFYTDKPAVDSISGIGSNWIQTAVLLPLTQSPDGKWVFMQNTTCFADTNTFKTLAKAKKHLEHCCH